MKILITFLFILMVVASGWTQTKKMRQFEKDLAAFRYSLYKDMAAIDNEKLMSWVSERNMEASPELEQKLKKFFAENEARIKKYRFFQLKRYAGTTLPDVSNYEPAKLSISKVNAKSDQLKRDPLYAIFTVNPLYHINMLASQAISKAFTATEYAAYSVRDYIGEARIITKRLNKDEWQIWFDKYLLVLKFRYKPQTAELKLEKFLKRKE